jgi:hypothetical protein
METYQITVYERHPARSVFDELDEALLESRLQYSMRHVLYTGAASMEELQLALQKSMQICSLAGSNSHYHFKPVYVFDPQTGITHTDWLMSKKAFCLMVMNLPLNEQTAKWLWELTDI